MDRVLVRVSHKSHGSWFMVHGQHLVAKGSGFMVLGLELKGAECGKDARGFNESKCSVG